MKKIVILYTVISMILLQSIGIYANEEAEYLTEAKTLQELGLFKCASVSGTVSKE
jgi:hypothetical membrane protein